MLIYFKKIYRSIKYFEHCRPIQYFKMILNGGKFIIT